MSVEWNSVGQQGGTRVKILIESIRSQDPTQTWLGGPFKESFARGHNRSVVGVDRLGDGAAPDAAEEDAPDEVEEDLDGVVRLRVDGGVEGASLHHDPVVDAQQGQAVRSDEAQEL